MQEALRTLARPTEARLFAKYRGYTMIARRQFIDNLAIAKRFTLNTPGDLVECGTWKGGMIAALAEMLPGRHAVLFDSYEGLPVADPQRDGPDAVAWQEGGTDERPFYDNCAASQADAEAAMALSGADYEIRKGWFSDTIPGYAAEQRSIGVLRIDGDWYDSTMVCLSHLFPLVAPGGLVILDDYGVWAGCTRAVHDYLSQTQAVEHINRTAGGVAFIVHA